MKGTFKRRSSQSNDDAEIEALLDQEEEARIRELLAAETWPDGWEGDEPTGDVDLDTYYADGSIQPRLFHLGGSA